MHPRHRRILPAEAPDRGVLGTRGRVHHPRHGGQRVRRPGRGRIRPARRRRPARLVARLGFWTWRTQETVDVVEWLRAHNQNLPEERQVRFAGVDPQRGADSVEAVTAFLRACAPDVPRFSYRFHTAPLVPAKDYDGIAFVARSTCSHPLPQAEE